MGHPVVRAKLDNGMPRTKDILVTYALLSPTVVVGAARVLPPLCLEQQWVLCISHTGEERIPEVARHLAMMNKDRKQDSVIFVGAEDHGGLLKVG